jgi:hypothetical protein
MNNDKQMNCQEGPCAVHVVVILRWIDNVDSIWQLYAQIVGDDSEERGKVYIEQLKRNELRAGITDRRYRIFAGEINVVR